MATKKKTNETPSPFKRVLPESMRVGKDKLALRLDFYNEAIVMRTFDKESGAIKIVSPFDIVRTLASSMPYNSGFLPENALWWSSGRNGSNVAIYIEPGIKRLALQGSGLETQRFNVPLPGLIFLCRPAQAPRVFAIGKRPTGPRERVYKAPLANVYEDGRTCPGNHKYPTVIGDIPDSFFKSFFSAGANLTRRSKHHPYNIIDMWKELDKKKAKEYPLSDLEYHCMVSDLMEMG